MAEVYFKKENGVFAASVVFGNITVQIAIPSAEGYDDETEKGLQMLWMNIASVAGEEEADRQMSVIATEAKKGME